MPHKNLTPDTTMSSRDATGKCAVNVVNAASAEADPVSETLCFLVVRLPVDGQSPETQ
jgi:hypothetical protein